MSHQPTHLDHHKCLQLKSISRDLGQDDGVGKRGTRTRPQPQLNYTTNITDSHLICSGTEVL